MVGVLVRLGDFGDADQALSKLCKTPDGKKPDDTARSGEAPKPDGAWQAARHEEEVWEGPVVRTDDLLKAAWSER